MDVREECGVVGHNRFPGYAKDIFDRRADGDDASFFAESDDTYILGGIYQTAIPFFALAQRLFDFSAGELNIANVSRRRCPVFLNLLIFRDLFLNFFLIR